jgi:hypothetical protein
MSGPVRALGHCVRTGLEQPRVTDLSESTRHPPPARTDRRGYPRPNGAASRTTALDRSSARPTRPQRLGVSAGERSTRIGVDGPACELPRDNNRYRRENENPLDRGFPMTVRSTCADPCRLPVRGHSTIRPRWPNRAFLHGGVTSCAHTSHARISAIIAELDVSFPQ